VEPFGKGSALALFRDHELQAEGAEDFLLRRGRYAAKLRIKNAVVRVPGQSARLGLLDEKDVVAFASRAAEQKAAEI
jgi:hypothetical protein